MRPTIELSMIVKNGAAGLPRCIESVRPLVDRVLIGDTGSTDDSVAIARRLGAEVLNIAWADDYAAARNEVLVKAECDWVLVLDADEELDAAAVQALPVLLANCEVDAFQSWIWNYVESLDYRANGEPARINPATSVRAAPYPAYFRSLNTRLFRRDPEVFFEHAIHENVLDRLRKLGRRRASGPFVIHHFGYVEASAEVREGKKDFYRRLSACKASAEPENGRAQMEMGMHELDCSRDYPAALPYLLKACALDPLSASAWLYAGTCFLRLGDHVQASLHLERSLDLKPEDALLEASLGDLCFAQERHREARAHYLKSRQLGNAAPLCLAKLGVSEVRIGLLDSGIEKIQQAEASAPVSAEILDMLALAALLAGQAAVAKSAVARRLSLGEPDCFGSIMAASVYMHVGCRMEAAAVLRAALLRFPEDRQLAQVASSASLALSAG